MATWLGRHHLCLSVEDVKKSAKFYTKMGFDEDSDQKDDGWIMMYHGNFRLDIYEKNHIPINLLNFRGGDVPKIFQEFKSKGITASKPATEHGNSWSAEITDPDGNIIFFNTYEEERDLEKRKSEFSKVYLENQELKLGRMDICLNVKNLNKSIEFYSKLGLSEVGGDNGREYAIMEYGNLRLGLYTFNLKNFTMNFRGGNVKQIYNSLKSKNFEFSVNLTEEADGSDGAGLSDPDGNYIYFNTHPSELSVLKI